MRLHDRKIIIRLGRFFEGLYHLVSIYTPIPRCKHHLSYVEDYDILPPP